MSNLYGMHIITWIDETRKKIEKKLPIFTQSKICNMLKAISKTKICIEYFYIFSTPV